MHTSYKTTPDKGKNIALDEDGFQQVRSRKNIRKNIFDTAGDVHCQTCLYGGEILTMIDFNSFSGR